jgi:hypothetical protein
MRVMPIMLFLLLAAGCGCARERGPNADVQKELASNHRQLGRGWMLFAATVVEGGGQRANAKDPPLVVVDITHAFEQGATPGELTLGRQPVIFGDVLRGGTTISGDTPMAQEWEFETPVNGTRIIAFATDSPGRIQVQADLVFADTEANRAVASARRPPGWRTAPDHWIVRVLFLLSLGFAVATSIAAWARVKFGLMALAASIVSWLAYEPLLPPYTIRLDVAILFVFWVAGMTCLCIAVIREDNAARGKNGAGEENPRHRHRLRGL